MSRVAVVCPGCNKRLSAPAESAGRLVRCPGCGNRVKVTAPPPAPAAKSPRSSRIGWILGAAAVAAVLLVAGAAVALVLLAGRLFGPPHVDQTPPGPQVLQPRERLKADAPTASTLRLLTPRADAPANLIPLVVMEKPVEPMYLRPGSHRGILARELFRQAVLLTAREELGLTTRDAVLREAGSPASPYETTAVLELTSLLTPGKSAHFTLARIDGERPETLWSEDYPLARSDTLDYVGMLERLETLTRTSLPEALRKAGFPSHERRDAGRAGTPPQVQALLKDWNYVSQFAAARALHATLRDQGESPALLADLVRAYSHLGVLTEHHWNPAHKAYKARALLYSQRQIARSPESPDGHWARGYALTLIGLHEAARADLDRAAKEPGNDPPAWAALLGAACRYDVDRLAEAARAEPADPLARWLLFQSQEGGAPGQVRDAADRLLLVAPDCFRVLDALSAGGDLGTQKKAIFAGPDLLKRQGGRLHDLPGAPAEVQAGGDLPGALTALEGSGAAGRDDGEPGWRGLANLLREDRFLQVYRRADYLQYKLQVSPAAYLAEARPGVADHPYHAYLDIYTLQQKIPLDDARVALKKAIDVAEVETTQGQRLALMLYDAEVDGTDNPGPAQALRHQDDVCRDLTGTMLNTRGEQRVAAARRLLAVSPLAPAAAAVLIDEDWAYAETRAAAWEKDHARHPTVLAALARRYEALKRPADVERCLKQCVRLSPDEDSYTRLALFYKSLGKMDLWRTTLEEFLTLPETGLAHAKARVDLARHWMVQKEYDKARPYAEAAAATGAEWAMRCASECLEQMGEWDASEQWAKRIALRYPMASDEWESWCLRNKRGDLKGALRCALDAPAPPDSRDGPIRDPRAEPYYQLLARDPGKALPAFQTLEKKTGENFRYGLLVAVLADETGQNRARDAEIQAYPAGEPLGALARVLRDHFQARTVALDLKAVEGAVAKADPTSQADAWYAVGRLLAHENRQPDAVECFKRCVGAPQTSALTRAAAAAALKEHGG